MKIVVISDLHIGHSKETHQLGHTDQKFKEFLIYLETIYDKIILLGDIFEIELENFLPDYKTYELCNKKHETITSKFKSNKYIYIFGNHDLVAEKYGALERYELEYNNIKYLFLHGHQFDHICHKKQPRLVFLGSWCLKLGLKNLYRWITEHLSCTWFSVHLENAKFQDRAIAYAKKNGWDRIITGHSHDPKILKEDNFYFMNSGTCTYNRFCYLHMDLDNKEYDIIKSY